MKYLKFNTLEIENEFQKAANYLFSKSNVCYLTYSDKDVLSFDANNKEFLSEVKGKSVVYCLWTGTEKENIFPKYVGHVNSSISRQRFRAHLTKKNKATGAQLDKITAEVSLGYQIGVTYLEIDPAYMRKSLEDWLIQNHPDKAQWNKSGKKKVQSAISHI
jgi:hypothetical protein